MFGPGDLKRYRPTTFPRSQAKETRSTRLPILSDPLNQSQIATVVCVALTSNLRWSVAPGNVLLYAKHTGLDRDSVANVSQLVTVDKRQLTERVGKIPRRQMEAIFSGIDLVMGR